MHVKKPTLRIMDLVDGGEYYNNMGIPKIGIFQ